MSDVAICAENLSKRYRIGLKEEMHDTFAGALTDFVARPIKNLRRLRRLTTFEDRHRPDDRSSTTDDNPTSTVHRPSSASDGIRQATDGDIIWALKDVSFEVERGEVVGIIGRNGAGKTTLLKILSRITEPTSGRVEIHGRVSSLLEVGTGFHPELTGRENIYLNGAILGMTKAEIDRKFNEIVEFSGVEKFIDTPVKRYSSGMGVRLAFSVAAHLEPEILLVDEVLAVGDAAFQKKCLGKMQEVAGEGRTVLFVSHSMPSISNLCSRAIWIESGQINASGDVERVVRDYLVSTEATSDMVLRARTDRQGDGKVRLTGVTLLNSGDKMGNTVRTGTDVRIVIGYEQRAQINVKQLEVDVAINDEFGQRITTFSNRITGERLDLTTPTGNLICKIPKLPLLGGRYSLTLWLGINGFTSDAVQNAFVFDVVEDDYFGTGKLPVKRKHGAVVTQHSWSIESCQQ